MVLIANTTLLGLIESWTNMEIALGAIARIKGLEDEVAPEDRPFEAVVPLEAWPRRGEVNIVNITASYSPDVKTLDDISLQISPGQNVVICGRTGSGESSLLLTFLKLLDINSGSITIDDINLRPIPRSVLRPRCFVTVPQDPLLFPQASLRPNLDPSQTLANDTIVRALNTVRLWGHFTTTPRTMQSLTTPF